MKSLLFIIALAGLYFSVKASKQSGMIVLPSDTSLQNTGGAFDNITSLVNSKVGTVTTVPDTTDTSKPVVTTIENKNTIFTKPPVGITYVKPPVIGPTKSVGVASTTPKKSIVGSAEWIQQEHQRGLPFTIGATELGVGPLNEHASSGFGSASYYRLQNLHIG